MTHSVPTPRLLSAFLPIATATVWLATLGGCGVDAVTGAFDTAGGAGDSTPLGADRGSILGVVQGPDGAPIAGAHVTTTSRGFEARAGADGRFALPWLPPGGYQLVVAADGWEPVYTAELAVSGGQASDVVVTLDTPTPAASRVEVLVVGADGQPLEGATVTDASGVSATTDATGTAVFEGLWGDLTLQVEAADGRHHPRSLTTRVTEAGGVQWAVRLSGRAPDDAYEVGAAVCAACHADTAADHADTLHANALAGAPTAALDAWFDAGDSLDVGLAHATLGRVDSEPAITLTDSTGASATYTVSLWLGSPEQASVPLTTVSGRSYPLPVAWVADDPERPDYIDAAAAFVPYETERWFDDKGAFQASGVTPDATRSADTECLPCHVTGFEVSLSSTGAVTLSAPNRAGSRWIDAGVSCERCHGPGSEHRGAAPGEHPFVITNPAYLDAAAADDVCGQCHSRTTSREDGLSFPWSADLGLFRPGDRLQDYSDSAASFWPTGHAGLPRMQADELPLSGHGAAGPATMACVDCHTPHGGAAEHDLKVSADDNTLCLSCHSARTFGGDDDAPARHVAHVTYDPAGPTESGRCASCHMVQTATGVRLSGRSAAGDLASHRFALVTPQDTLDLFGGADTARIGSFETHACADCHAWNAWNWEPYAIPFPGPFGDPTLAATHEAYQAAYEEKYP